MLVPAVSIWIDLGLFLYSNSACTVPPWEESSGACASIPTVPDFQIAINVECSTMQAAAKQEARCLQGDHGGGDARRPRPKRVRDYSCTLLFPYTTCLHRNQGTACSETVSIYSCRNST